MVAQSTASVTGFRLPAANGATVNGIRAADINLHCDFSSGKGTPFEAFLAIHTVRKPSDSFHEWEREWALAPGHSLLYIQPLYLVLLSLQSCVPVPSTTCGPAGRMSF